MTFDKNYVNINLFPDGDPLHDAFDKAKLYSGGIFVGCLGDEDGFILIGGEPKIYSDPKDIADCIRENEAWSYGTPVTILASEAGVWGTSSPAQKLSKELGAEVYAPAGYVYLWDDGTYIVSELDDIKDKDDPRIDWDDQGRYWFSFCPR